MPATTTTRTPLAQICSAINLPYSPLQPGTEEEVVRRYFLWMLTSLQLQKKALQHQEEPALEAARGLFAQWDSTGIKPPPAVWSEALDRMHGKPQGHFMDRLRTLGAVAYWAVASQLGYADAYAKAANSAHRASVTPGRTSTTGDQQRAMVQEQLLEHSRALPLTTASVDF